MKKVYLVQKRKIVKVTRKGLPVYSGWETLFCYLSFKSAYNKISELEDNSSFVPLIEYQIYIMIAEK